MDAIVVFSHLRWNFVYQRPQQVMSRLATHHAVIFVEEPVGGSEHTRLETYEPCTGVTVLRAHVRGPGDAFHDVHVGEMQQLLRGYLMAHRIDEYLLWFYTPMALLLAKAMAPSVTVYDCMDELAAFDFAPP